MPHADSSLVPETIQSKADFWAHVYTQLEHLLGLERNWASCDFRNEEDVSGLLYAQVSNLANASSVIYNSLLAFPAHFGTNEKAVNWCGKSNSTSRCQIDS
jgi:L-methionine (R)-S-oxide reductase